MTLLGLLDPEGENTTILELTYLEYGRTAFIELPDPAAEISTILTVSVPEDEMLSFDVIITNMTQYNIP